MIRDDECYRYSCANGHVVEVHRTDYIPSFIMLYSGLGIIVAATVVWILYFFNLAPVEIRTQLFFGFSIVWVFTVYVWGWWKIRKAVKVVK